MPIFCKSKNFKNILFILKLNKSVFFFLFYSSLRFRNLKQSNLIWLNGIINENFKILRWFSIFLPVSLFNNIKEYIHELLWTLLPNLGFIIWKWKQDSYQLIILFGLLIVNSNNEFLLVFEIIDWALCHSIILAHVSAHHKPIFIGYLQSVFLFQCFLNLLSIKLLAFIKLVCKMPFIIKSHILFSSSRNCIMVLYNTQNVLIQIFLIQNSINFFRRDSFFYHFLSKKFWLCMI